MISDMKTANFLHRVIAAALMIAALATGQQALAETVTYTISGTTEKISNDNYRINFTATASGSATGTASDMWEYATTQSRSNISLPGGIKLSFGSDKTSSLAANDGLIIQATATNGGYITLSHASKYIYHITLRGRNGTLVNEAWNLEKSYTYRFHEMRLQTIVVEYADLIPFNDAEIQGIDDHYFISDQSVTPQPTGVIWHGISLGGHNPAYYNLSWANASSAGTATITATGSSRFTGAVTKNYALLWATYTVRFHSNDGQDVTTDQAFTYNEAQNLTANAFTRTAYTFDGWSTSSDGAVTYADGESVNNLTTTHGAIVDLYAHWTPITYHITYDSAGGKVPSNSPTTYTIESGNITIPILNRTGYTFLGWTGTDLTEPTQTVTIPANSTGDRSYTANWSIITYTITYNIYGGEWPEGQIHPDTYTIETPTFRIGTPTKTGYIFYQWNGGYNTTIWQGSTGNRTYSADWYAISYSVHFDANGGEGTMSDRFFVYDHTINLTANAFTRMGYTFTGWNTKADGTGTAYTDGQSVSNLTTTSNDTINLYAQWTPITYHITYELNGGAASLNNPTTYTVESGDITISYATKHGYNFLGWTGTDLTEPTQTVTIPAGSTGDRTFTANWSPINYTITYELYGGEWPEGQIHPDTYTIETPTFTIGTPTKTGYMFQRWNGHDPTIRQGSTDNRTYTASWVAISYYIHFDANSGEGTMSDQDFLYDYTINLLTNAFTRLGYIFTGWNTKADGTGTAYTDGQSVSNLTTTRNDTINLYAQWTPITYIVRFHSNDGGEDVTTDQAFTYDEAQNLTANAFTRIGYTFHGWNTKADGTGTAYADGQSVVNLTTTNGATVTLYAQWTFIGVPYIDADGTEKLCTSFTVITSSDRGVTYGNSNDEENWYVVSGEVTISGTLSLCGQASYLILCDGATLTITISSSRCISTPYGSLTLYGQSQQSGTLNASTNGYGSKCASIYTDSDLTINGGIVNTTSSYNQAIYAYGGNIVINRGFVNATVEDTSYGRGIYSSKYGGHVTINGGNVSVNSGCIGIISSGNVTINGGNVIANGNNYGLCASSGDVTINGGRVTATGGTDNDCYGIYAGQNITLGWTNASDSITASSYHIGNLAYGYFLKVADGQALTDGTDTYIGTLDATQRTAIAGKTLVPYTNIVPYIDADGTEKLCTNFTVITSSDRTVTYGNSNDEENWYVVSGEVTISGALLYGQASHLILCDGATLTVTSSSTNGIASFGSLTLYGQSQQSGTLNARTNSNNSSVAGIYTSNGGDITINGGIINATSAYYQAIYAYSGNVVINRGTVNATAEAASFARGIYAKNVTINGGIVNATSSVSGIQASGGDVTINGGRVTANGGSYGINANNITLGWTNASDSITASSYRIGSNYILKIADGQTLTDGTDTYTGTLTDTQRNAIAGQTLVPYISISVGDVNGNGEVNIADVTALVALILSDSPYNPAADINGDNRLSIADVTALVNNIKDGN